MQSLRDNSQGKRSYSTGIASQYSGGAVEVSKTSVVGPLDALIHEQVREVRQSALGFAVDGAMITDEQLGAFFRELHTNKVSVIPQIQVNPFAEMWFNGQMMPIDTAAAVRELHEEMKTLKFSSHEEYFKHMTNMLDKPSLKQLHFLPGCPKITQIELLLQHMVRNDIAKTNPQRTKPYCLYMQEEWSWAFFGVNENVTNHLVSNFHIPGLSATARRSLFEKRKGVHLANLLHSFNPQLHIISFISDNLCVGYRNKLWVQEHQTCVTSLLEMKLHHSWLSCESPVMIPNFNYNARAKEIHESLTAKVYDLNKNSVFCLMQTKMQEYVAYHKDSVESGAVFLKNVLCLHVNKDLTGERCSHTQYLNKKLAPMGVCEGDPASIVQAAKVLINLCSLALMKNYPRKIIIVNGDAPTVKMAKFLVRLVLASANNDWRFNNMATSGGCDELSMEERNAILKEFELQVGNVEAKIAEMRTAATVKYNDAVNALNPKTRPTSTFGRKLKPTEKAASVLEEEQHQSLYDLMLAAKVKHDNELASIVEKEQAWKYAGLPGKFVNLLPDEILDLIPLFGFDLDVTFAAKSLEQKRSVLLNAFLVVAKEAKALETDVYSDGMEKRRCWLYLKQPRGNDGGKREETFLSSMLPDTLRNILVMFCVPTEKKSVAVLRRIAKILILSFKEKVMSESVWNVKPLKLHDYMSRMLVNPDFFHGSMSMLFGLLLGRPGQPSVSNLREKQVTIGPIFILFETLLGIRPQQLGLYKGYDRLYMIMSLLLVCWYKGARSAFMKTFHDQIQRGFEEIVTLVENKKKEKEEKKKSGKDESDEDDDKESDNEFESLNATREVEAYASLVAKEKDETRQETEEISSDSEEVSVVDISNKNNNNNSNNDNNNNIKDTGKLGRGKEEVNQLSKEDIKWDFFRSEQIHIASFFYVMDNLVPLVLSFIPQLENLRGENRLDFLISMLPVFKALNCTVYFKTFYSYVLDLIWLKENHNEAFVELMLTLPSNGSICIEHFHAWIDHVSISSARDAADLNKYAMVYGDLRNGRNFMESELRTGENKANFEEGRGWANMSSWCINFDMAKMEKEGTFANSFIAEMSKIFNWINEEKKVPHTTCEYITAMFENDINIPDFEFKPVHEFSYGKVVPPATPCEWNELKKNDDDSYTCKRIAGRFGEQKSPIKMFEDFEQHLITPREISEQGTNFEIFNTKDKY